MGKSLHLESTRPLSAAGPPRVGSPKAPAWFWLLAIALVFYVALCTSQRDNKAGADAWEHLRALRALTEQLWHPGNPTFASSEPSVRYSPYLVALAVVSTKTGIQRYDVLSAAAVLNVILLIVSLYCLLAAFEQQASAGAVLFVMISLWGAAPGYANSYAFSDLPWNEVNASAFSFPMVLFAWSLLQRTVTHGWTYLRSILIVLLVSFSTLDHGMTGAFGVAGLLVIAVCAPASRRRQAMVIAVSLTIAAGLVCMAWPWYSFVSAVTSRRDVAYWFNPYISELMFTTWCMPAMVGAMYALPLRSRPLVRLCLVSAGVSLISGILAFIVHSPVLARFPLLGMIYLHTAIGIFAQQSGIFKISSWSARFRDMTSAPAQAAYSLLQVTVAIGILYFLLPQVLDAAKEPFLGRAYLTKVLHLRYLQENVRARYVDLLAPVGLRDVVLSDPDTSWIVPSFRGRVVSAMHYELFVPNQPQREQAVRLFFSPAATEQQREDVIHRFDVQWIVLNPKFLREEIFRALLRPSAVVRESDGMVLIDAAAWMAAAP